MDNYPGEGFKPPRHLDAGDGGDPGAEIGTRPMLVAIPFYKNENLVRPVVGSLIRCADEMRRLGCEAVFYNDSPGHVPLHDALENIVPVAENAFACRIENNPDNIGFVRTMNRAVAEAVSRGMDLLLLNSDTVLEPGALTAMARCLTLDHMIGFVNPRSNNATIATLPVRVAADATPAAFLAAARNLAERLPQLSYIPTAIGFCLLIRWSVLAEFGGFDEIYGRGYNEENDLVMRAGRCGYRAVMANDAFVWHEGETSFATSEMDRSVWEPANRAILDARYPEYGPYTSAYYHSPEAIAENLLACLIPDADGKLDLGFDFSSFRAAHNGTFQAGRQLLQTAVWENDFRIWVICSQDVYDFHGYAELGIPRSDPHDVRRFAAIFRVGQPYDWNVIQRAAISAPVLGVYMLDTISIDCPQMASPTLYNIWQFTIDHSDLVAMQSRQTRAQFNARFTFPATTLQTVALHSLALEDYRLPSQSDGDYSSQIPPGTILIIGNHFHHKYLNQTANAVAAHFPDRNVLAMGAASRAEEGRSPDPSEPPPLDVLPNLKGLPVGGLKDAEIGACYAACSVVIFPSLAEGFGFPLLNALAAGRPVFVRPLPVFLELWEKLGRSPNIHFYESTPDLLAALAENPRWIEATNSECREDATFSAREIHRAVKTAIAGAEYGRIVRRVRAMQFASEIAASGRRRVTHPTQAAQIAHWLAVRVECVVRRALSFQPIYRTMRAIFQLVRKSPTAFGKKPITLGRANCGES